jgi:hypothetical protein
MELFLIRGVEHAGKTTAAARILKSLVREYNASVRSLILDWYCVPVIADNDKTPDFQAIVSVNELSIGIISQGDCACDLKNFLDEMLKDKSGVDILILCARSRNTKGSTYELICQRFGDLVKEDNTYWLNLDDKESKKKEVAYSITKRILQEAKVL